MNNAKPCKGIGKAHGVEGCGTVTPFRKYGLCDSCRSEFYREDERGKIIAEKAILKAISPRLKAQKDLEIAKQERKQKNTLQSLKDSVMIICHKYIRERDKYKPCISCGAFWNEHFQAGHFYKAELYSNLKYHPKNINGQCRVCNLKKDGNFEGYRSGILERYGKNALEYLDKQALKYKKEGFKWDREQLKEERKIFNDLYKQIK